MSKALRCPFCPKAYSSASTLSAHKHKWHKDKGFTCETCERLFFTEQEVFSHTIITHANFVCNFGDCSSVTVGSDENRHRDRAVRKHVAKFHGALSAATQENPAEEERLRKEARWTKMLEKAQEDENGCLRWTGRVEDDGYGRTGFGNEKGLLVHVLAYRLRCGDVPPGMVVRHKCSAFKDCINPDHLEVGTHVQNNSEDKIRDGTLLCGEKNPNAKLSDDVAREIFTSKGTGTQSERAQRFDVPLSSVEAIDAGYTYAKATGAPDTARERMRELKKRKREEAARTAPTRADYESMWKRISANAERLPNGCLKCLGKHGRKGYVYTTFRGGSRPVHALAWEMHRNDCQVSDNQSFRVVHTCDTSQCIEPTHLVRKSTRDVQFDRLRNTQGAQQAEAVIRSQGTGTVAERAEALGVSANLVSQIDTGRIWGWLQKEINGPVDTPKEQQPQRAQNVAEPPHYVDDDDDDDDTVADDDNIDNAGDAGVTSDERAQPAALDIDAALTCDEFGAEAVGGGGAAGAIDAAHGRFGSCNARDSVAATAAAHEEAECAIQQDAINDDDCADATQTYCELCDRDFRDAFNYRRHFDDAHTAKKRACDRCDLVFATASKLQLHVDKVHVGKVRKKSVQCTQSGCRKCFWTENDLTAHLAKAHAVGEVPTYKCPHCMGASQTYATITNLNKHLRKAHTDKPMLSKATYRA